MSRWSRLLWLGLLLAAPAAADTLGLGRPATQAEIDSWNIDIRPDGQGLPPGSGGVAEGGAVFAARCAGCHSAGAAQPPSPAPPLAGGIGSLATPHPLRTVGSYWPFATTLFDYVRRAMPFDAPGSLNDEQVYAITAFLLNRNGIVAADAVMNATTLQAVRMPNRAGFRSVWESGH